MARDEQGNVIFDAEEQVEVDRIIQERLSRAKPPEDYKDLQEINSILDDFDYSGMTMAEKKAELKKNAEAYKASKKANQDIIDNLEQKKEEGERLTQAEKDLLNKASKLVEKAEKDEEVQTQAKAQATAYEAQRTELLDKHGVDANDLSENKRFMSFVKGKTGINLIEQYENFVEFIGETEAEAIIKVKSKEERSTSSGKGGNSDGATYGLTANQQTLAKKNGMAYKEYAELLKNIQ